MHPWPSCNGRTRNAVRLWVWVYEYVHITFIAPLPTSPLQIIVSQSVTNNRCAPLMWGHKRKVRGHIQKFSAAGESASIMPPTCCKLLPTPLTVTAYIVQNFLNPISWKMCAWCNDAVQLCNGSYGLLSASLQHVDQIKFENGSSVNCKMLRSSFRGSPYLVFSL